MGFQDRKKHDNVEKEKVHLLSLGVPFSFARKVSVHATLYDKKPRKNTPFLALSANRKAASRSRRPPLLCFSQKLDPHYPLHRHAPPSEPMKQRFCIGC